MAQGGSLAGKATAVALVVLAVTLAGCSSRNRAGGPGDPGRAYGGRDDDRSLPVLLYSPNAEPLNGGPLGNRPCAEAVAGWFDKADANRDGRLTRDEFLADAKAQFGRMDLDGEGVLTSSVVERYRQPFREGTRWMRTAGDPVMSADQNMRGRVSLEDFQRQSGEAFDKLDAGRSRTIGKSDLAGLCPRDGETDQSGRR